MREEFVRVCEGGRGVEGELVVVGWFLYEWKGERKRKIGPKIR